jgi:hypothetical protein
VERVRNNLMQGVTNSPKRGTFEGWVLDGSSNKVGIKLSDVSDPDCVSGAHVELSGGELVYVSSYDETSTVCSCPPWFRAQLGSPQNETVAENSMVTIDPRWAWHTVAQAVVDGIRACEPELYQVKTTTLTSSVVTRMYVLPSDVEEILTIRVVLPGTGDTEFPLKRWSVDTKDPDGSRYLHVQPIPLAGMEIKIVYRAKATAPSATNGAATWASTGLPASAEDLPVLWATATLLPSPEAARTQVSSIEQSERARFIQPGSGTTPARFWMQEFQDRKAQERRKLLISHPVSPHFQLNG